MSVFLGSISPVLLVACAVSLGIGIGIFVRNLWKRDAEYEFCFPWWVRLYLYSLPVAILPPMGLMTGLGTYMFGKNRQSRRFARGMLSVSLIYLAFYVAVYFDPNSSRTDCRSIFPPPAHHQK